MSPNNHFIEVMSVPVLSTAHLPDPCAVEDGGLMHAPYLEGWFVHIWDEPEDDPEWFAPIRTWAKRISPSCSWVRFDADADTIFGLEVYEW